MAVYLQPLTHKLSVPLGLWHSTHCSECLSPRCSGTSCKASPALMFILPEPDRRPGGEEVAKRGLLRMEQEFQQRHHLALDLQVEELSLERSKDSS